MKKVRSKLCPTEIGVIKTFSLSPDDEVGEIAVQCSGCTYYYNNLSELCEKWEDYEEPKGNWTIDPMNENYIDDGRYTAPDELERYEELGLKFNTKEEAEKAAERLRAWKRLKDKGFRFVGWDKALRRHESCDFVVFCDFDGLVESEKDLDLLFFGGGE